MGEWPKRYHPAGYDDGSYVVDDSIVVEGWQLRPDTWDTLAAWCGGTRVLDGDGNQALAVNMSLTPANVAHLGDFVMRQNGVSLVSRADGHYQRWAEVNSE